MENIFTEVAQDISAEEPQHARNSVNSNHARQPKTSCWNGAKQIFHDHVVPSFNQEVECYIIGLKNGRFLFWRTMNSYDYEDDSYGCSAKSLCSYDTRQYVKMDLNFD